MNLSRMYAYRILILLCYLVKPSLSEDGGEGGAGGTFRDYLPMKYLSVSSSEAQDEGGATKSQFYDFLPAELQGRRPNYLEIRSLYSVSNLDVCIT